MFSGIVEAVKPVIDAQAGAGVLRLKIQRPQDFSDIKNGDSIAVNGVCLTVEEHTPEYLQFAMAAETLHILRFSQVTSDSWVGKKMNLERSLRFGDRIHGHLVTGHVDALGQIKKLQNQGESLYLDIQVPEELKKYLWTKGSVTLHGVSLTLNQVAEEIISVCLIPETQKRTNLAELRLGDWIHIEADYFAKMMTHQLHLKEQDNEA